MQQFMPMRLLMRLRRSRPVNALNVAATTEHGARTVGFSLLTHPADAPSAQDISRRLVSAGLLVQEVEQTDTLVVLLSEASTLDQHWLAALPQLTGRRIVPVVLGVPDPLRLPAELADPTWVRWDVQHGDESFGRLLTALQSRIDDYRSARQLLALADAWVARGRPDSALPDTPRAARAIGLLLESAQSQSLVVVPQHAVRYARDTRRRAKSKQRRRWLWRAGLASILAAAAFLFAVTIPSINAQNDAGRLAQSVGLGQTLTEDLPAYSALLAANLLLEADTPVQDETARRILEATLPSAWPRAFVPEADDAHVDSIVPLAQGRQVLGLWYSADGESSYGHYDLEGRRVAARHALPGRFGHITASNDGRSALAVGFDGYALIDLSSGDVVRGLESTSLVAAAFDADGQSATVVDEAGALHRISSSGAATPMASRAAHPLALETGTGSAIVVDEPSPGTVRLIDSSTDREVLRATVPADVVAVSVVPDADRAVVAVDALGSLWRLGVGGVKLMFTMGSDTAEVTALSADRFVVYGGWRRPAVVDAAGQLLGRVCDDVPRLTSVRAAHDTELVTCKSRSTNSVWTLPRGPVPPPRAWGTRPALPEDLRLHVEGNTFTLMTARGRVWPSFALGSADITVVAYTPRLERVVVGTSRGEVGIFERAPEPHFLRLVTKWTSPDRRPVRAVTTGGEPTADADPSAESEVHAQTESGLTWVVPDCFGCSDEATLLAVTSRRLSQTGCWEDRQLTSITERAKRFFGLVRCSSITAPPVGR